MYRTGRLHINGETNKKKHNYQLIKNNVTPEPKTVIKGMGMNVYKLTTAATGKGKRRVLYFHFNVAQYKMGRSVTEMVLTKSQELNPQDFKYTHSL
jgi:hypothetical protein